MSVNLTSSNFGNLSQPGGVQTLTEPPKQDSMGLLSDSPAAPASRAKAISLPLLAGLVAAAAIAAFAFDPPHSRNLNWPSLLRMALERVLGVSIVCAITASAVSPRAVHADKMGFTHLIRRASVIAVWIAPLALFIHENSFWTVIVSAVFTVLVANSISFQAQPTDPEYSLLTSLRPDDLPLFGRFGLQSSVLAALCAQVGLIAAFGDHMVIGAFLVSAALLVWTRSSGRSTESSPSLRPMKTVPAQLPTLLIASLLTVLALIPFLQPVHGTGSMVGTRHLFRHRSSGGNSKRPPASQAAQEQPTVAGTPGDMGIILWPEKQNYTKLVAPTPIVANARSSNGNASPLNIPFDGVYWYFKSPDVRPPAGSREAHATPDQVEIRSTDQRPLSIEAHDHLANLIDLDCCSRIEVAIRNADRYPETVWLEIVLVNTTLPHTPSLSLGRSRVNSTRPWSLYEKRPAIPETLAFAIPPRRSLHSFDEVKILFRLDRARADWGAKIAIDHFVLVPRGL